ncbi:MFS transporter [Actinotalea ferrariae]|uniref:MFS transporter n=1 Tax=Actinotalea ferrariae TaxID=1386098 RepID=UPI001C8B6802|nr:MFS transporter [Actinotalea ferrariae]MBX9245181.1 MFS transporter [Actinotalea ferrariae]
MADVAGTGRLTPRASAGVSGGTAAGTAGSGPDARATTGVAVTLAGMLLIATTYGMARFGVGLFAPMLAAERPELAGVLGWAAAAQFASYSVAAASAARVVDRRPGVGLVLAGVTATAGCVGVALAQDPVVLVLAVVVGGLGGGFASPALVPVVDAVVAPEAAATAQSVVNAGTAVGVVGAGIVSFAATTITPAWTTMAAACALTALAAWYPVRRRSDLATAHGAGDGGPAVRGSADPDAADHDPARTSAEPAPGAWRAVAVPGAAAVVAGAGSALVWTFGPLILTEPGSVPAERVGWLWTALGAGGLVGAATGTLVRRTGRRAAWCTCTVALALAAGGVALSVATGAPWAAYAGMAVFGAAYMGLSAVLILWARQAWPSAAGAGTSVLFIALATGQALGSTGFGAAREALGPVTSAVVAAALCVAAGLAALAGRRPGRSASPQPSGRSDSRTASATARDDATTSPTPSSSAR